MFFGLVINCLVRIHRLDALFWATGLLWLRKFAEKNLSVVIISYSFILAAFPSSLVFHHITPKSAQLLVSWWLFHLRRSVGSKWQTPIVVLDSPVLFCVIGFTSSVWQSSIPAWSGSPVLSSTPASSPSITRSYKSSQLLCPAVGSALILVWTTSACSPSDRSSCCLPHRVFPPPIFRFLDFHSHCQHPPAVETVAVG